MTKHWIERLIIIISLCLLSSGPYLVGWWQQSPTKHYEARIPSNVADTAAYFSNIEQARQGRPLFTNQLTSEPQRPSLFQPVWLVTGWMARVFQLTSPVAFHVARCLAIAMFVLVLEVVMERLFPRRRDRLLSLVLITTSSGLGWLLYTHAYPGATILHAPIDLWIDEANTFRSLGHSALFVGSQTALLWLLWTVYRRTQGEEIRYARWVGPVIVLLGLNHPYDLITLAAVTVIWIAMWGVLFTADKKKVLTVVRAALIDWLWVTPVALYYLILPLQQLGVRGWFAQNINPSPTPFALAMGLGLLLPLAIVGLITMRRRWGQAVWFIACWALTTMLISYAPHLDIQRRLLSGVHLPIALLAAAGLIWLGNKLTDIRYQVPMLGVVILFLATTNIRVQQTSIEEIRSAPTAVYPIYHSQDVEVALQWLRGHSSINDLVVADFWSSNEISGLIARPVMLAHGNQTVAAADRQRDWDTIVDANTLPEDRTSILRRLGARWLFWVPGNMPQSIYQPQTDAHWQRVYTNTGVSIFRWQGN